MDPANPGVIQVNDDINRLDLGLILIVACAGAVPNASVKITAAVFRNSRPKRISSVSEDQRDHSSMRSNGAKGASAARSAGTVTSGFPSRRAR